jgi:hypothetical protein
MGVTVSGGAESAPAHKRRLLLLSALVMTLVTLAVLLIGAEIVLRLAWKDPYMFDRRLMFFSEGRNFENTSWGGLGHVPNADVHAVTYYITELEPRVMVKEYDYRYSANALGRVQHLDVDSVKPSLLFLGDSFTEGQGAVPWFYTLEQRWPRTSPYQLINGGTLGTGVEEWTRLYHHLSGKLNVSKVVMIYIGDDWHRPVWQFPNGTLACLASSAQCIGDENFYGLPADSVAAAAIVERIATYRTRQLLERQASTPLLQRTALYKRLGAPLQAKLKRRIRGTPTEGDIFLAQVDVAERVVTEMVEQIGRQNVLFIYLPQRQELSRGPDYYGKRANDFITRSGYSLMDGRAQCGLLDGDYHPHDGHPNAKGYAKIEACVRRATQQAFGAGVDSSGIR